MKKIVLASKSPRRKDLLEMIGVKLQTDASNFDESRASKLNPEKYAMFLSRKKAETVAKKFSNAIIIGADTIVLLNNEIIGKPKDAHDAKKILQRLSGKMHIVITGLTVIDTVTNRKITTDEKSKVYFKKLTKREIENYVNSENLMDKAGAYAIQGKAALFIEKIEGDYFNVVGLPLFRLSELLKKVGLEIL